MLHRKILLYVFLQRGNSRTLNAQVLWLFCRGRPSQHLKFDIELYLLVKLACESQLTEILFKLLIKLACESQLTESYLNFLLLIFYYSSETKFLTATPPRALTLQTPNSAQIFRLISPGVLYLF